MRATTSAINLARYNINHFWSARAARSETTRGIASVSMPSAEEFNRCYFGREPVVIQNGLNWPAFNTWSLDHIVTLYANTSANAFEFDLTKDYQRTRLSTLTIKEAIDHIKYNADARKKYYLVRQSIPAFFPSLGADIEFPPCHPMPSKYDVNLWAGEKGNKTPLHFDATHNFLVQVKGKKELFLFPNESKLIKSSSPLTGGRFNFSPEKFCDGPDHELKKLLAGDVSKTAYRCVLSPGMAIYIPIGWWHQVNTLTESISVNYFWSEGKIEDSCRSIILDYQATRLYDGKYPEYASKLVNDCTYDNCLETVNALCEAKRLSLAGLVLGLFIEELIYSSAPLLLGKPYHRASWLNLSYELKKVIPDLFHLSEAQLRRWADIVRVSKSEDDSLLDVRWIKKACEEIDNIFSAIQRYRNNSLLMPRP